MRRNKRYFPLSPQEYARIDRPNRLTNQKYVILSFVANHPSTNVKRMDSFPSVS
jgi:hypothetical protein